MALEGDLAVIGLADIFQTLAGTQKAGTLVVENSESRKSIYFQEGMVWVVSEGVRKNIKLGESLIAQNKITPAQLASALEQQQITKERLGEILQSMSLVTEGDVEQVIRSQLEEDIFDVFTWKAGKFKFLEETIPEGFDQTEDVMNLNVQSIVMEAARRTDELEVIREYIPSDDYVFKVVDEVACEQFDDSFKELLLGLLTGQHTVNDLCEHLGGHRFEIKTALAELMQEEVIACIPTEAMVELGIGAMEDGDPERASRILQVAVSQDPSDVGNFLLLAEAYESINDKKRAGQTYKSGATAAAEAGEVEHAVDFLARARRLLPNDLEVNEQVIDLLATFSDHIPDAEPRFMEEGKALVKAYRREKRYPDSIRLCRRLLQEDPEDIEIHKSLVNIFLDQKDDEEALAEYDVLAQLLTKKKDYEELQSVLEKIAKLDPSRTNEISRRLDQIQTTGVERRRRSFRRMAKLLLVIGLVLLSAMGYLTYENAVNRWTEFENDLRSRHITKGQWAEANQLVDDWAYEHGFLSQMVGSRINAMRTEINSGQRDSEERRDLAHHAIKNKCSPKVDKAEQAEEVWDFGRANSLRSEAIACFEEEIQEDFELQETYRLQMDALREQVKRVTEVLERLEVARQAYLTRVDAARETMRRSTMDARVELLQASDVVMAFGQKSLASICADPEPEWQSRRVAELHDFAAIEYPVLVTASDSTRKLRFRRYRAPTSVEIEKGEIAVQDEWQEATTPLLATIPFRQEIIFDFEEVEGMQLLPRGANVSRRYGVYPLLLNPPDRKLQFHLTARTSAADEQTGLLITASDVDMKALGGTSSDLVTVYSTTDPYIVFDEYHIPEPVAGTEEETCTGSPVVVDDTVIFPANDLLYRIDKNGELVAKCDLGARRELGLPSVRSPVIAPPGSSLYAVDHRGNVIEVDRSSFEVKRAYLPAQPQRGTFSVEGNVSLVGSTLIYDAGGPYIIAFDISKKTFSVYNLAAFKAGLRTSGSGVVVGSDFYVATNKNINRIPVPGGWLDASTAPQEASPPVGELVGNLAAGPGTFYGVNLDSTAPTFHAFTTRGELARAPLGHQPPQPSEPYLGRISSPVYGGGLVLVGSVDGMIHAFEPWAGGEKPLTTADWSPVAVDRGPIVADPRVVGGRIYVGTTDNGFRVISAETGESLWLSMIFEGDQKEGELGRITQAAAVLGERILVATGERIYSIRARPR